VLRTLPEMVISAPETTGYCSANDSSRSFTFIEFLNFVQNCNRMHGYGLS
jgi:hypothetical protein